MTEVAFEVVVRQWLLGIGLLFATYVAGQITPDIDESKLRPWMVTARNDQRAKVAVSTAVIVVGGIGLDRTIFQSLLPAFKSSVVLGIATVAASIVGLGIGVSMGKWLAYKEFTIVEGFNG